VDSYLSRPLITRRLKRHSLKKSGHGLAPNKDLAVSPLGLLQGLIPIINRDVKILSDFNVSVRTSRITAAGC